MSTEIIEKKYCKFVILDQSGDDSYVWDSEDPQQIKDAKAKFDKWKSKGYKLFKVIGRGKKKKQVEMRKFDPKSEEILVIKTTRKG